jgi:methyltransferase (TIGR00027 family)
LQAVSRTATVVALWKATESSRSASTQLFEDPFAAAFLGWRFRWALHLSRLPVVGAALPWSLIDGHWPGSRGTVVVRTRYIDDVLGEALRMGVEQVVILGAGFDSRAYRIPGIEATRVFEVDHPLTQAKKKDAVARRLGTLPPHVTLVSIDFSRHTLDTVMLSSGYRRGAKTFLICEGVTHYLPARVVDAVFEYVAQGAAVRSRMVFTYIHRAILDGRRRLWERTKRWPPSVGRASRTRLASTQPNFLGSCGTWAHPDRRRRRECVSRTVSDTHRSWARQLAEFQRAALVEISRQSAQ